MKRNRKSIISKFSFVLVIAILIGTLAGCSGSDNGTSGGSSDEVIEIRIGHIMAPTNPVEIALQEFKTIVEEESGGRVVVETYHSGVLGGEMETFQQTSVGQIDAMVTSSISILQGINSLAAIEELPFLFPDKATAHSAYDGEFGDRLIEEVIEPNGVKAINFWENGFRHFTNNVRPINKPEDMAGIKFRSAEVPLRIRMFESLGADAIPMALSEVFTGLQQGTIDGQENPLSTIDSSKLYEVQEYLSLSGHIYNGGIFVFNQEVWDSYPQDIQDIIINAAEIARDYERELIAENDVALIEVMEEAGVAVNEIEKELFVDAVQVVWDEFIAEHGDEVVNIALKYVE